MEDPPTDGSPKYARELIYRARSSLNESSKLNNTHMIEHTIELTRELHALTTRNSADGVVASLFLAESLRQSFQVHGTNGLLEEIINIGREAVTFCPEKHPNRASSCRNLAQSLKTRYNCTGDAGLLDEAMDLGREALRLQPVGHPNRAISCGNLSGSLKLHYKRTGDVGFLDEAINLEREALDLCPARHPDRSAYCNSLARLLSARYERTGDAGFLDEAIDLEREVLDLCPARHPDRSAYCINLARSLTARYKRTGNVGFLDEAIDLEREALGLCPAGHPDRSVSCNSLGSSLLTRYERTGDVGSYDEGIDIQREALRLRPVGHPDRATSCGNLAGSLKIHYERTSDVGLLDEAIDLQREALNLRPVGHLDRSMSCISFANLLRTHFLRTGDVGVLHEAIDLEREALDLCPVGRPDRSMTCGSLARSLNVYFEYTGDIALFQESLTLFQEAISISPLHEIWRHSCALAWTFLRRTSPYYDVRKAILYLSQSLTHDADDPVAFVLALSSLLDYIWLCNLEGDYIQLTTVYRRLVNLLPLLIHPAVGLQSQLQALKKCNRLGSDAFVNAALANDWSIGLETLELAQGVIWSTSLHRRDPQLKDVPDHLASRLQDVLQSIAMSSAARPDHNEWKPFISPRDILHTQSSRLYTVLRDIRALPGLERFMLGESVDALRTAASDHPVVVLVGAREHYYALILAASLVNGHMVLSLHLSDEHLTSLSYTRGSTRAHRSDATPEETPDEGARRGFNKTESAPSKPLDGQLQTLWHKVVKPVLAQLGLESLGRGRARTRLHWCATGIFSNLPLHAAGIHDGSHKICCSDFVVSSYTPTITSLLRVQQSTKPLPRGHASLALVAEKRAKQRNLEVIPEVDKEIAQVAAVASLSSVDILHQRVGLTTIEDTSKVMEAANIVHLACHGIQDANDATQSGFCLGDGRLTIAKLMELKLDNAFLAFLSACETAKGDRVQPDQAMHLAAAMLFSGFKSVVATMWAIQDSDGPKVAEWFYKELFAREVVDGDSVAYALDSAVGKLRASGVSPERWAPFIHMGA